MKWFGSKGEIEVEDMGEHHARNALAKLRRGDYFDASGNPPSAGEAASLESALMEHLASFPKKDPLDGE